MPYTKLCKKWHNDRRQEKEREKELIGSVSAIRDHPFKTSACLRGGGVSPCADGPKVTVHKDQKSPS